MNISKRILLGLTAMCCCSLSLLASCGVDEVTQVSPEPPTSETERRFVTGADVSWLTQLEKEGRKFYTRSGEEKECMRLLRDDCGVGAIRLRVWLDPADGWMRYASACFDNGRPTRALDAFKSISKISDKEQ